MKRPVGAPLGPQALGRRHLVIGALTATLFVVLVGRLWVLQVSGSSGFDDVVTGNRTRTVTVEGPRGRILDAEGRDLAVTVATLAVTVDWQQLVELPSEERFDILSMAASELAIAGYDVGVDELDRRYQETVGRDLLPAVVVDGVDPGLWIALEERDLPGIGVDQRPQRRYPHGATAAHVIGHLGTVESPEEAARLNAGLAPGAAPYEPGGLLGRSGIEQRYEAVLRGKPGIRRVEVDATGRVVRTIEVVQEAEPGLDVQLTIDLALQLAAEGAMVSSLEQARALPPSCADCPAQRARAGSVVAIRPSDGAVVAIASYPSYDPNWFIGGENEELLAAALVDVDRPLLNRAIAGRYPPGSTFKPVVAYASVTTGFRPPNAIWTDVGQHRLANCLLEGATGCLFHNAGGVAMGDVDLPAALARSSDTYFYSIGEGLWAERQRLGPTPIQDVALAWGLGAPTGLGLGGEASGFVPVPDGAGWFVGDNVNLAIGQGDLLVTPLQLASMYATIAADGRRTSPRLVSGVLQPETGVHISSEPVRVVSEQRLDQPARQAIEAGLVGATVTGTAATAFAGFPSISHPIAGKTGTAQVSGKADFSLFAGYGTGTDVDLAIAVVLEEAGWGSTAAAPAARTVFEAALTGVDAPSLGVDAP